MEEDFEVIVLSRSGDFLLKEEEELHRDQKGVEIENPYVINEEEEAQPVQATQIFIPYTALENIQYGSFEHKVIE
ncbi:MAG: hypothetical protein ABEJ56_02915 [Candidatus Nanohaloarchaea archaeon]